MLQFTFFVLVGWMSLHEGLTLECYTCNTPCDLSEAILNKLCGTLARSNLDAFCTTESILPGGFGYNNSSTKRIRRCLLTEKGTDPDCPEGRECAFCMSDKCNDGSNSNDDEAPIITNNNENTPTDNNVGSNVNVGMPNVNLPGVIKDRKATNNQPVTNSSVAPVASMFGPLLSFTTLILSYFFVYYF